MMYTSRVPRVTTSPVLAPLRSISVLMAMVEPWISSSIAAATSPLLRMQSMTPCTELRGRGEALGLHELPARFVEPDQIGKGAADIDRNNNHATEPSPAFGALRTVRT